MLFFFFSSRRRHTRLQGDWSSDVCSSDLVRRADVLVRNGLEEDAWIDVIVRGAANPRLLRGSPNVVEASQGIRVLKVPAGHVDRSLGDVHPLGSPHYTLDPDNAVIVTGNIAAGPAPGAPAGPP